MLWTPMSPKDQPSSANSSLIIVASVGLFLATTAIAQFAQALGRQRGADREEDFGHGEGDPADLEVLRRWYRSRRVHDRLSYENINDSLQPPKSNDEIPTNESSRHTPVRKTMPQHRFSNSISPPSSASTSPMATEWDLHRLKNFKRSFHKIPAVGNREGTMMSEMHPNADYDFHPKNRNWRHHFKKKHIERYIYIYMYICI